MACQIRIIKFLHYTFIVIFVLYGLAICFSVLSLSKEDDYVENLDESTSSPIYAIMTIIVGIIIIVIACMGFCGAYRENYRMLMTFVDLLTTFVILYMFITICVFAQTGYIDDVKTKYRAHFVHYNDSQQQRIYVNAVQKGLQCCGVDYSDDFQNILDIDIPGSCCGKESEENSTCSKDESYERGCVLALKKIMQIFFTKERGITIGIVVIEVIGIVFASWLANFIKNPEHKNDSV